MFILISDNEIAGKSVTDTGLPNGFTAVDNTTDVNELDQLYWDGQNIQVKPVKPEGDYRWDKTKWVEVQPPFLAVDRMPFRKSQVYEKARLAGRTRIEVQMELTIALAAEARCDWEELDDAWTTLENMLNG